MLNHESEESSLGGAAAQGLAGHQLAGSERLHFASLVFLFFIYSFLLVVVFSPLPYPLSLSQPMS